MWLDVRDGCQCHARALTPGEPEGWHALLACGHTHAVQVRAKHQVVCVGAVPGELALHELEGGHLQVELLGMVLVDDRDASLRDTEEVW